MKKKRGDSVLDNLPANQQELLERWLFDDSPRLTYAQAKDRIWQDFGVKCSLPALSTWWQCRAQERTLQRISRSAQESKFVVEEFRRNQDEAFDALMAMIGQAAFEMKMRGEELSLETLKDLADVAALGLKAKTDGKKIAQKDREIEQQERKFQVETCELFLKWFKDEKAREIAESNLTNSDKIKQLRQTYFKDVDELQQSGRVQLPQ